MSAQLDDAFRLPKFERFECDPASARDPDVETTAGDESFSVKNDRVGGSDDLEPSLERRSASAVLSRQGSGRVRTVIALEGRSRRSAIRLRREEVDGFLVADWRESASASRVVVCWLTV